MRLDLATYPVKEVKLGSSTAYKDGVLEIDPDALAAEVLSDPRIATARIELASPGESVRIWPVRDVIEPRIKVEGPGVVYPGICDRPMTLVGSGRTNRLSGVSVVEVSEVQWHDAGHDWVWLFIDMLGPWGELNPYSGLFNICVVVEPHDELHVDVKNRAVHNASLTVSDRLAATTASAEPAEVRTYELKPSSPPLPKVVFIQGVHSSQGTSGNPNTFCTSIYGATHLELPRALHPNEMLDGAMTGPYRTAFATSWTLANNPLMEQLYDRHGVDFDFVGVIPMRTEWTRQDEKDWIGQETARLAYMMGADGAVVTWDAGGNEQVEVIRVVQACERMGIKAVFVTHEDISGSADGVSSLLEPVKELDALVSTGTIGGSDSMPAILPGVERVIGSPTKLVGDLRDESIPTAGPQKALPMYDDHYGFNNLIGMEY
ncbi:MAG: hypothetical protein O3A47_08470 [Chloroflexi bacterium]|nr:hypothetical protein [Chloroflexota bacterium]